MSTNEDDFSRKWGREMALALDKIKASQKKVERTIKEMKQVPKLKAKETAQQHLLQAERNVMSGVEK